MKKLTNEEKILQFLLNKYQTSKTTKVAISKSDLTVLDMNERDVTRSICTLQADQKLVINARSQHDDLSRFWEMTLTSAGIYYFDNKRDDIKNKIINVIAFMIPTIISIIALFT